uniref:Connector enhancer of kinase suppressor of ras 2 n=1 Tax=Photinus pyralis TaxID=7054 RepID=A0A1Y1M4E1_PHOPY
MAYVNVKDWSVEQVTEWLKGLDSVIAPYTKSFVNNEVKGNQLLSLRSDDLEHLGVYTIGHQEIILEAVEHLRNFHYKLDKENLQMLALRLSCAANSLYNELALTDEDCTMVPTQTMSDVHNVITAIKPLVCWLDRSPFRGNKDYVDCKIQLLQLSFEMATHAHRDIFSEKPLRTIRDISKTLVQLADHIIQEMSDPMILQPASLALATLKKKEQELGFFLLPSHYAVHQIAEIKYGSPAHNSSKIQEGDEIVQVNYQTVVGWQRKNVLLLLQESPPEIVLTLKKRPRHTKIYGQIYMKPYRLPSKKRATPYSRWNDNLPSPQLLAIHDLPDIPPPRLPPVVQQSETETEISSSSDSETLDSPLDGSRRVYPLKPRPVLQRRNTVTGASPTSKRPQQAIEQYWQQLKNQAASRHSSSYTIPSNKYDDDSTLLRDKSVSCGDGFDLSPRPTTVIGIAGNHCGVNGDFRKQFNGKSFKKKKVNFDDNMPNSKIDNANTRRKLSDERSVSVTSLTSLNENLDFIDEGEDITDRSNMRAEWQKQIVEEIIDTINVDVQVPGEDTAKDDTFAEVHVHNIIKKFDEQSVANMWDPKTKPKVFPKNVIEKPPELPQKPDLSRKPAVPPKNIKIRGHLSKCNSTPAYDQSEPQSTPSSEVVSPKPSSQLDLDTASKPITYELGIPFVEDIDAAFYNKKYPSKPQFENGGDGLVQIKDYQYIPPKPPPRANITSDLGKNSDRTSELKASTKRLGTLENLDAIPFEPKNISTPNTKGYKMEFPEVDVSYSKSSSNLESLKMASDTKISPTNSIVRAMMYSSKSKSGKKKNSIVARRRKVAVKDVAPGEIQGYLYQRLRSKQSQSVQWEKRWFVLNGSCLYGFLSKESVKAKCLIFLSGFTASIATEVKSRSNAFKVYHTGTVFYFSADNPETLSSWIELITAGTLLYDNVKSNDSILFSESDDSDSEKSKGSGDRSNESLKKFGSLKKTASGKSGTTAPSGSSSLDRKWFFNKTNSIYKNSVPVPTAQFRSYRKIPSASISTVSSISTGNFTSHIPDFSPRFEMQGTSSVQSSSTNNLATDLPKIVEPEVAEKVKPKQKPINYVHASNPNLCDISDFHLRNFQKIQPFQHGNDNLAGFVTLEELMNRQTEEQKLNPHAFKDEVVNPSSIYADVVYGELPIRPSKDTEPRERATRRVSHSRTASDCSERILSSNTNNKSPQDSSSFCFGKRGSLKKQKNDGDMYGICTYPKSKMVEEKPNQSLPRTHKVQEGMEVEDSMCKSKKQSRRNSSDQKSFISREYSVSYVDLKDKSNEMVYCPQTSTDVHFAQNRTLDGKCKSNKIIRQHSLTSMDKKRGKMNASGEKMWIDSLRKNDKVCDKSSVSVKLKSAMQYTPMSLPLTPNDKGKMNPKFAFELNLDEKVTKTGKFRSFFGKQSENKKEKCFMGSPKFARSSLEKGKHTEPATLGWPPDPNQCQPQYLLHNYYYIEESPSSKNATSAPLNTTPSADYPGLEYPPVFEPETYSLSDPQCSINLLRKQDKNN